MPIEMSIAACVADLSDATPKRYLWSMETHGVEMGFARGGQYSAHAHRNLVDIMFAPGGMGSGEPGDPGYVSGSLLIALPGTWFGPVAAADFFFVKFYCDPCRTGVPDKIIDRRFVNEGSRVAASGLIATQGPATIQLPIYRPGHQHGPAPVAEIRSLPERLTCKFPNGDVLIVAA